MRHFRDFDIMISSLEQFILADDCSFSIVSLFCLYVVMVAFPLVFALYVYTSCMCVSYGSLWSDLNK